MLLMTASMYLSYSEMVKGLTQVPVQQEINHKQCVQCNWSMFIGTV